MRDAFGGVFTMNLLLVFIFIFVAFAAVSLNYAKAFRLKNSIIDFIEQNEIIDLTDIEKKHGLLDKLDTILGDSNYYKECDSINLDEGLIKSEEGIVTGYCHNGVVILTDKDREEKIEGTNSKIVYYKIKTYADWELGALNKILALAGRPENSESVISGSWTVNGEAKVVLKG